MNQPVIQQLIEAFTAFPGIGPRQARRFVYYLLASNQEVVNRLIEQLRRLKQKVASCAECRRFFSGQDQRCSICLDQSRDPSMLVVVEKDFDLETIENSGAYRGYYFVLGGLTPLTGEDNPFCRWRELVKKIERQAGTGLREVIFALVANPEGDQTVAFLKQKLTPGRTRFSLTFSSFGRGLSTGTELEYADSDTIRSALRRRDP